MSTSLSINFCSKVCLSFDNSSCIAERPFVWINQTPLILSLSFNDTSGIIQGKPYNTGNGIVQVLNNTGFVIYTFFITVTGFNPLILGDHYIYSTYVDSALTNITSFNFNGPFNTLFPPSDPNVFIFTQVYGPPVGTPSQKAISTAVFNPSSTASTITNTFTALDANLSRAAFVILRQFPSSNPINPIFSTGKSTQTILLPVTTSIQNIILPNIPPCGASYLTFIQSNTVSNNLVLGSTFNSSFISFNFGTGVSPTTMDFSYFITVKGYVNLLAITGLFYSDVVNFTFPTSASSVVIVSTTLPNVPNTFIMTNFTFFAQVNSTTNTNYRIIGVKSDITPSNIIFIVYEQVLLNQAPLVVPISIIGFVKDGPVSSTPFTIT